MRWSCLILVLAGCQQLFGLEAPTIRTADASIDVVDGPCMQHVLPPAVNVDPRQFSSSFLISPTWICDGAGTTTIDTSTVTVTSTSCALGTADVTAAVSQTSSAGYHVFVVRLRGLTISGGHVLRIVGDKPVVFLVAGDVVVDTGGLIDASAATGMPGPGGSMPGLCADQARGLGGAATSSGFGGGGGGFGTAGGVGGYNVLNGGAAATDLTLVPLRGGCSGGATVGQTAVGAGGGAIEISASGSIAIGVTGPANIAASGGGAPAMTPGGGNGGGAGGGILLVAPTMPVLGTAGALRANGGAGSEGCGTTCTTNEDGTDGHKTDAVQATDTSGTAGGGQNNDHGRAGGLNDVVGSGQQTAAGDFQTAQTGGRGGGGGGGGTIVMTTASSSIACD